MNMASQSHVPLTHVCWGSSQSHMMTSPYSENLSLWGTDSVKQFLSWSHKELRRAWKGSDIIMLRQVSPQNNTNCSTQQAQHVHCLQDIVSQTLSVPCLCCEPPSMLLFPEACYSLPLVVVLSRWSRTYNKSLHLRLYKTSSAQFSIKYGKMFMKQFPQRLKDALLFIDSSSYCKCLIHFSSGCFHYVKLVILFLYLHQGPDVSTSLFARGKKTRVMIPVKSVEGCLLSIKAETSRNRTFLPEMFFFSLHLVCHRGNDPCVWLIDWI